MLPLVPVTPHFRVERAAAPTTRAREQPVGALRRQTRPAFSAPVRAALRGFHVFSMAGLRRGRPLSALPGTLRLVCSARLLAGSLLLGPLLCVSLTLRAQILHADGSTTPLPRAEPWGCERSGATRCFSSIERNRSAASSLRSRSLSCSSRPRSCSSALRAWVRTSRRQSSTANRR